MMEIINEKPITLNETQKKLNEIEERDKELKFRATKTKEYLKSFTKLKTSEVERFRKKLTELNISRLKERQIVKIIDTTPKDMDSLKMLLSGETISPKSEDLKKILTIIEEFAELKQKKK